MVLVYIFRGMMFHSLLSLENYFSLKDGVANRYLEEGKIKTSRI